MHPAWWIVLFGVLIFFLFKKDPGRSTANLFDTAAEEVRNRLEVYKHAAANPDTEAHILNELWDSVTHAYRHLDTEFDRALQQLRIAEDRGMVDVKQAETERLRLRHVRSTLEQERFCGAV